MINYEFLNRQRLNILIIIDQTVNKRFIELGLMGDMEKSMMVKDVKSFLDCKELIVFNEFIVKINYCYF